MNNEPVRTIFCGQYSKRVSTQIGRSWRTFGDCDPRDGIETGFPLKEFHDETTRVLRHRHARVHGAVIPTTREEVDGPGRVDTTLRTDYAAVFRIRGRVDDDSVQGCAFFNIIQGYAVAGGSQVQKIDARVLGLDQPGFVHALHRREVLRVCQDLLYRSQAGDHLRQRTSERDLAAGAAQSSLLESRRTSVFVRFRAHRDETVLPLEEEVSIILGDVHECDGEPDLHHV